jgi:AcrR family transcriptional regulator
MSEQTLSTAVDSLAGAPPPGVSAREFLVNVPQQARSRRTLERLVEAARALLREGGPDAVTVNSVAEHSGTSVGSFYSRFSSKEELMRYLGESDLEALLESWDRARPANADGRALLEELALYLVWAFDSGPAARLFELDGVQDPQPTRAERARARLLSDLEGALAGYCEADAHRRIAARVFLGGARELARDAGGDRTSDLDLLGSELARAVMIYAGDTNGTMPPPEAERARASGADAATGDAPEPSAAEPPAREPEPFASEPEPSSDKPSPPGADLFDVWG